VKLYRNVREMVETDRKTPEEYISQWKDGERIWLKGTKTFGAQNETDLFLKIEEVDVIALFYALLERYEKSVPTAETVKILAEANSRLAECLRAVLQSERDFTEILAKLGSVPGD